MLNKIVALAGSAVLACLLLPAKVDAYGAVQAGYAQVGPDGVYYTRRTAVSGPGGTYVAGRTVSYGAPGYGAPGYGAPGSGGAYGVSRYNYGYAGGVGVEGYGHIREREGLSGNFVSQGGAPCSVRRDGDSYIFTNDQGSWARFVFAGPNRLEQVEGQWDRNVVCVVIRDEAGRTSLRFDSPNARSGYWTAAD
jgi:hypothetical protein